MDRKIVFLDIETVPAWASYEDVPAGMRQHWLKKAERLHVNAKGNEEESTPETLYSQRAGIYAEFGKVICISLGLLVEERSDIYLRTKSYFGHDEAALLTAFAELLEKSFYDPGRLLICGHNIKEFDIPYICRRMLVHGIPLPEVLQLSGKKPWEIKHLADTMEMWRFGDIKNFTSLDLLAAILEVPSSKDDIDGSQVSSVYWKDNDLDRIVLYCEKDVLTAANVFQRLNGLPLITKTISA